MSTLSTAPIMTAELRNSLSYFKHLQCLVLHKLNPWRPKSATVDTQCDAEKNRMSIKGVAKKTQNSWQPLKSWVFGRVPWVINSCVLGLSTCNPTEFTCEGRIRTRKTNQFRGKLHRIEERNHFHKFTEMCMLSLF